MEQNKTTPMPWKIRKHKSWSTNVVGKSELNDICEMSGTHSKSIQNANASAIVSAVNNTYGVGIRPEATKELLDCLTDVVDNLMLDFPDDHHLKSRYKAAIEKAKL